MFINKITSRRYITYVDFYDADINPCTYGNKNAKKTAVIMGDSFSAQWFHAIEKIHESDEWKIVVFTKSACAMVDEPYFSLRLMREFTECASWRNQVIEWIQKNPAQRLFIGSAWYEFSPEQRTQGTLRILDRVVPYANDIYIFEPIPRLPFGPECIQQRDPEQCYTKFDNQAQAVVVDALKQAIAQHNNVHWLNTVDFVCPKEMC